MVNHKRLNACVWQPDDSGWPAWYLNGMHRAANFLAAIMLAIGLIVAGASELRAELCFANLCCAGPGICSTENCSTDGKAIPDSTHHHCAQFVFDETKGNPFNVASRSTVTPNLVFDLEGMALPPDPPPPRL